MNIKKIVLKDKDGNKIIPTRVSLAEKINELIDAAAKGELTPNKYEENSWQKLKQNAWDKLDPKQKDILEEMSNNIKKHVTTRNMDGKDDIIDINDGPFLVIDQTKVIGDGTDSEICALLYVACEDMLRDGIISKSHLRTGLSLIIERLTK